MKKQLLLPGFALLLLGVVTFGATSVSAQDQTSDHYSSLITKIAQKFNLKEADVKSVFDEDKQAMQTKMKQKLSDNLSQLVTQGKITEVQKNAIIAKMAELQKKHEADRQSQKSMTPEQRKAAMDKERSNLEAWAKEQGIDLSLIKGFGRGMGHGFGHGMGMKMMGQTQQ